MMAIDGMESIFPVKLPRPRASRTAAPPLLEVKDELWCQTQPQGGDPEKPGCPGQSCNEGMSGGTEIHPSPLPLTIA